MWSVADMPSQAGRTAIVTGASAGIGFETAKALAERGAHVVLAVRDPERGARVAAQIQGATTVLRLDLAALADVRQAAAEVIDRYRRIDLLINNAGTWAASRTETRDGFELQFGTNHLGHFAFTGLVMPSLLAVPGSRIVTVASLNHRLGRLDFTDLHMLNAYRNNTAYARSKLANLLFAFELNRRLAAAGVRTVSLAAHPGGAMTDLFRDANAQFRFVVNTLGRVVTQSAQRGSLPTLRAATDPEAKGGEYYGPDGLGELKGSPKLVRASADAYDEAAQRRLWVESERLTGVDFRALRQA